MIIIQSDLQKKWYFPKTSGFEGGETCQSWPCCYDFKEGEITARVDWVWAVYTMSLMNRYYMKDPIDGMWVRGLLSSGLADIISNLNLRRSVTNFSEFSVSVMIYCTWDCSLTVSMILTLSLFFIKLSWQSVLGDWLCLLCDRALTKQLCYSSHNRNKACKLNSGTPIVLLLSG